MKSGDGGVDLIVYHRNGTIFVQCKNYVTTVDRRPVQALDGFISRRRVHCSGRVGGIVVAHRNRIEEDKFDPAAVTEATICRNLMKLSYANTIVEDIEELMSMAERKEGFTQWI
ncbi:4133_t:CDS:2 [Paraglomus occultum]|uniref:4133_t:CDS:1 n=1 Tax=Paraglomus occultum TaxID=144539 RepID=A0A9N9CQ05_9GLOM|nr:4133_t:CDS:2 [Paraglomus occultum]